jgi:hypothetical protein
MLTGMTNPGHGNDACVNTWPTAGPLAFSGGQCVPIQPADQGTFGNFQATPLPPQGGSCTGTAQPNTGQLTAPTQRFCDVPSASANSVCAGTVPAGFSACIVSSGQVPCPASTSFLHPFAVEDGATLQCSSCTACSTSATCSNASVSVFTDAACATAAASTLAVTGTCVLNGHEVASVMGIKYAATSNTTCTAGSSTGSAQLTGPRTICCQ